MLAWPWLLENAPFFLLGLQTKRTQENTVYGSSVKESWVPRSQAKVSLNEAYGKWCWWENYRPSPSEGSFFIAQVPLIHIDKHG